MPHILHRDRWKRCPPPGWRLQLNHPLAQGIWSAQYVSGGAGFDALRGSPLQTFGGGNVEPRSRNYRGGRYVSAARPSGGPPYWFGAGRTSALSTTSDVTLVALLGGDGRSTFPTLRVKATTVYWQEGVPAIIEGNGSVNVMVARFYGTGNVTVDAVGTSSLGQTEYGKVVSASYDNGSGIGLWVEGRQEAFTSSALNLALAADEVHMTGANTIMEYPPVVLGYSRVLSEGEQRALAENPFQMFRPVSRATFFSLAGGAPTLTIDDITHGHPVDAIALGQVHQLAVQEATHGQAVDAIALTQVHQLSVNEATHAHPVDSPVVDQAHQLTVSDTLHGHVVDTLDLAQVHQLVVQDATHAHPTDAIALTQQHLIAVANCLHQHALDHLSLSGVVTLAIQDILHGHAADGVVLGGSSTLQISDILHAHAADAVALGQVHVLVVSDAVHAQLVDAVALSLPGAVLAGERALVIPTETRALVVVAETRALAIAAEVRALTIH